MEQNTKITLTKNDRIRESFIKTKMKRKSQDCRVFQIKIQDDSLKPEQREALKMQFVEAKWVVNSIISWSSVSENKIWEYKVGNTVIHKDKDMNDVESEIKYLGSQMKQSIVSDLVSNLKTLNTLKKKGKNVGKLKYRSKVSSINLKQYGSTYKIIDKHFIKIQNIPGKIRVNGLSQICNRKNKIKKNIDIANAKILDTPKGYYLAITTYHKKTEKVFKGKEVGIDLGCSTTVTLSNGQKFDANIQETDRLKKLQRKLARQQGKTLTKRERKLRIKKSGVCKRSKGIEHTKHLIQVEYQKINNRKNDLSNKIVHEILQYEDIYIQDENLKGWQKGHYGKTVQHSVLGRIKAKIKPHAKYVLGRFEPTTKMCYNCGQIHNVPLNQRMYVCDCGIPDEDRDVHAAKNMIVLGKIRVGLEQAEFTHVDSESDLSYIYSESITGRSMKVSGKPDVFNYSHS